MTDNISGYLQPGQANAALGQLQFIIRQELARVRTIVAVKVMAVSTQDQVGPTGTVDVQPLVNMVDGVGANSTQHSTVHSMPFIRSTSPNGAYIADPAVGDIGVALISDRDISGVKSAQGVADPGSQRRFDLSDGMYLGATLTGTPIQYMRFLLDGGFQIVDKLGNTVNANSSGMAFQDQFGHLIQMTSTGLFMQSGTNTFTIDGTAGLTINGNGTTISVSSGSGVVISAGSNNITINSSGISITDANGNTLNMTSSGIAMDPAGTNPVAITGTITATTEVVAGSGVSAIHLSTHKHSGVTTGAGQSGSPVAGT